MSKNRPLTIDKNAFKESVNKGNTSEIGNKSSLAKAEHEAADFQYEVRVLEYKEKEDLIELKKTEARFIMSYLKWWSAAVLVILFIDVLFPKEMLPSSVYITIFGTTFGQVLGLEWLILNHCFPSQKPKNFPKTHLFKSS